MQHRHAESRVELAVDVDASLEHDLEFQAYALDEQERPNTIAVHANVADELDFAVKERAGRLLVTCSRSARTPPRWSKESRHHASSRYSPSVIAS